MTAARPQERLIELIADVLEVDPASVTDADGPATLPGWTSLRHLQLIVTLEETYRLSFAYEDVRQVDSVGGLRAVLRAKGVPV
ncbi:acyl carrier protein [Amycolatopsis balhimycina DSM 5908]|uniref:Acyl carrier protein n=1 Tax=Amycolatopsis balhimycina DSM 5908 TaxID=1081091 RepID=A0A428WLA9_AMYBA|nr:acyl carrier protein [Amycolatopsis balhimycina]RSM43810.1 acyl carrier protein [Amycolatopsis balhimycina DSM 5908]